MIGGSKSTTQTRSASTVDTQNLNLQDIEGVAVAGVRGPVSIQVTDQGAIRAGRDIALSGMKGFAKNVQLTRDISRAGLTGLSKNIALTRDIGRAGLSVFSKNVALTRDVVRTGRDIALSGLRGFSENVKLTRDILRTGRAQSETAAGLAGAVLARESTNVDPRLEDVTKFALAGAAVVVAAVVFKG